MKESYKTNEAEVDRLESKQHLLSAVRCSLCECTNYELERFEGWLCHHFDHGRHQDYMVGKDENNGRSPWT